MGEEQELKVENLAVAEATTKEMKMDVDSSSSLSVLRVEFPTEDVVQALLDYLVDPVLPLRSSSSSLRDHSSSLSLQQSVAKQVHAVVLLYNYYHRKQFPHLEFLDFESFCKVAVNAKPSLLVHMKFMRRCNSEPNEPDKMLSLTEKAIMDACNISLGLDALRDAPCIEGWPVAKVAIFLTDSMKKNCLFQFSSTTQGVWSLIEKTIDDSINIMKRPLGDELNADEASFQEFAFSAVKDTTGIDEAGLLVLERHVVPSLSAEKTTTCFYLMQCTKPVNQDLIQVPIEDAINSLQGPLVKKDFGSYAVSTVVEYFHLLPYAAILSDWFSRAVQQNLNMEDSPAADNPGSDEVNMTCQTSDIIGKEQKLDVGDLAVAEATTKEINVDVDSTSSLPVVGVEFPTDDVVQALLDSPAAVQKNVNIEDSPAAVNPDSDKFNVTCKTSDILGKEQGLDIGDLAVAEPTTKEMTMDVDSTSSLPVVGVEFPTDDDVQALHDSPAVAQENVKIEVSPAPDNPDSDKCKVTCQTSDILGKEQELDVGDLAVAEATTKERTMDVDSTSSLPVVGVEFPTDDDVQALHDSPAAVQENVNIEVSPAPDNPDSDKCNVTCQTSEIMGKEQELDVGDLAVAEATTKERTMDVDSTSSLPVVRVEFPTEDVVQALLDYLVDPVLPLRSSSSSVRDHSASLSLQQSIAKQMHAVTLLYNYYHRKQFRHLEFLDFESFCKVSVNAKPSLLVHMKFMQRCNSESNEPDKMLSLTEKAIMDACNISLGLDALRDAPCIEGWPVSKVAIFLTDRMKKNCLLLFSSTTQGVWSLIEKTIDGSSNKDKLEKEKANSIKRIMKRPLGDELNADNASFQELAFSAVKDSTGIDQAGLMVLERHVVPSLSAQKTTACFYLMQCTKPLNQDLIQVPIEDAINSLQGPLVKNDFGSYEVSTVVEYFHLLPYAGILSDWFSRAVQENGNMENSPAADNPDSDKFNVTCQNSDILGKKASNSTIGILNQDDNYDHCLSVLSDSLCRSDSLAEDIGCRSKEDKSVGLTKKDPVSHIDKKMKTATGDKKMKTSADDKKTKTSAEGDLRTRKSVRKKPEVDKVPLATKPCNDGRSTRENVACRNDDCNMGFSGQNGQPAAAHSMFPPQSNSQNLNKIQTTMASKAPDLLQASLRMLHMKRDELSYQQRLLQDEIALCEKNIQAILSGGDDNLMLHIESIIDACNRGSARTHLETHQRFVERSLPQDMKSKKLSEAFLCLRDSCQELDAICCQNNWILPRYSVLPSNGEGFRATIIVQGMDFECSDSGDLEADPRKARESAAAHILIKLRSMASQARERSNP